MQEISKLAELRKLMLGMERTLGLQDLSSVERDIYYAAHQMAADANQVQTTGLLEHTLISQVSRPTFFRALKSLVRKGYLSPCQDAGRGRYTVNSPNR